MVTSTGVSDRRPPSVIRHARAVHSCLLICNNPQLCGLYGGMSVSIRTTHMSPVLLSSTKVKMNILVFTLSSPLCIPRRPSELIPISLKRESA
jgi:hypothetical protein